MISRMMSIDYGKKNIGIAITDPLRIFAKPFTTIQNKGDEYAIAEIAKIVQTQSVDTIILGLPISTLDNDTDQTLIVRAFHQKLCACLNIAEIVLFDERYTTSDANDFLIQKGTNYKDSKKVVDQIAAAMILKSYLAQTQSHVEALGQ